MLWSGWGDPAKARELPPQIRELLHDLLGVREPAAPAASFASVRLAPVALSPAQLAAFERTLRSCVHMLGAGLADA